MNTTREYGEAGSGKVIMGEYNGIPCRFNVGFLPDGHSEETLARVFYYVNRCIDPEGWTTGYNADTDMRITPKPGAQAFNVDFLNKDGTMRESLWSDYDMLVTLLVGLMEKVNHPDVQYPSVVIQ